MMATCGFWMQNDLLRDLAQLMDTPTCGGGAPCSPPTSGYSPCDQSRDFTPHILFDGFSAIDPLDMMRSDAHEEFLTNGVDVELDEVDIMIYQSRLRERSAAETLICEQNPVLMEYMKMKERRKNKKCKKVCVFCKNNGEPASVYQGHVLKDGQGRVSCPILRKYTCPLCGTSGDTAHTIRYCPRGEAGVTTRLLNTGRVQNC